MMLMWLLVLLILLMLLLLLLLVLLLVLGLFLLLLLVLLMVLKAIVSYAGRGDVPSYAPAARHNTGRLTHASAAHTVTAVAPCHGYRRRCRNMVPEGVRWRCHRARVARGPTVYGGGHRRSRFRRASGHLPAAPPPQMLCSCHRLVTAR